MEMRKCIGSAKFGIEAHEAPIANFPKQASQKDGLGRMCRIHWNAYTLALRKAALERKAAEAPAAEEAAAADQQAELPAEAEPPKPKRRKGRRQSEPVAEIAEEPAAG